MYLVQHVYKENEYTRIDLSYEPINIDITVFPGIVQHVSTNVDVSMKVAMINDCAFVGETLLKYLPADFDKIHVKRTRGFLSKTLGIGFRVLRTKADVYHAYYLLQDCYLASRLGKKPLVGHAMGSDLRQQLNSRKWGRIVRHNLRNCDHILVCQPTILEAARKFNETAEYFPIPFDPQLFFPKPLKTDRKRKRIFIASVHDFAVKGTDKILRALAAVNVPLAVKTVRYGRDLERAEEIVRELDLDISFIDLVTHDKINELYWDSDLVLGSFGVGQIDTVAIEAMACGRPLVHSIFKEYFPLCPLEKLETIEETSELVARLLTDKNEIENRVHKQLDYVNTVHSATALAERLIQIYSDLIARHSARSKN